MLILYTIQQTYINETKKKETLIEKITYTAFQKSFDSAVIKNYEFKHTLWIKNLKFCFS